MGLKEMRFEGVKCVQLVQNLFQCQQKKAIILFLNSLVQLSSYTRI
jgi:hypothetical protein